MKYINEEEINAIRENANIVDVIESYGIKLEKKGKDNYVCLCPFHDDHNPNMIVSQAKQIFTCFGGCGATGNVFTFVQKYENVSFIEAVKIVAEKSHQNFNYDIKSSKVNDKYSKEYEVMDLSLKFFQNNLASSEGIKAKEYLFKRGITEPIINEFKLGLSISNNSLKKFFESKNVDLELAYKIGLLNKGGTEYYDVFNDRIMIPIFNQSGKLCGYTGRCYLKDEENKYVNSKENEIYKKNDLVLDFDWGFMKHHSPQKLIDTLKKLAEHPEIMKQRLLIRNMKKETHIHKEVIDKNWKAALYCVREWLAEERFEDNNDFEHILTIEWMENSLSNVIPDMNLEERRLIVTRIILLCQEESCFRNYIVNDTKNGLVKRGFRPGENAVKILGETAKQVVPYIYALYIRTGAKDFYEYYDSFIEKLNTYFYHERFLEYGLDPYSLYFFEDFFQTEPEGSIWSIEKKLAQVRYLLADYLDGNTREYDHIFQLVNEWELGYGNSSSNVELLS